MVTYKMNKITQGSLLAGLLLLSGCSEDSKHNTVTTIDADKTKAVRAIVTNLALTGDPSTGRNLPSIDDEKSQLGMKLFFTKALSGDLDSACVTCHHPTLGGGDDLSLPIGVDAESPDLLGRGRIHNVTGEHYDGGPTVPRNAPTTFNLAMWDKVLFHDGRIESLTGTAKQMGRGVQGIRTPDTAFGVNDTQVISGSTLATAQARFPVTSPEEMKNFGNFAGINNTTLRTNLEQRLGNNGTPLGGPLAVNDWLAEFQKGYKFPTGTAQQLITFPNIADAIAAYENSQVFVNTPWKAFVQGDDNAITLSAKLGAELFFNSVADGGANCASCHSGDFFTDEKFHVIGMPQIGRGKGDGPKGTDDFGRFRETGVEADKYAFRTATLLNVSVTGPWGHAGGHTTLTNVVKHHLNPQLALDNYDFLQLNPNIQAIDMKENTQLAIDKLIANRTAGIPSIEDVNLTDTQVSYIVDFLKTLTDPCVEDRACIGKWIPDASDTNPDILRINALDENNNFL